MTKNFTLLTGLKAVMTSYFNAVHVNEQRPFADRFEHESHLVKPFMDNGGVSDLAAFAGPALADRYKAAATNMLDINAAVKERIDQCYQTAVEATMAFFAAYEEGFKQDGRMTVISGDFGEQPITICPFRLGELRYDEHFDRIRARLHFGSDTGSALNANQEWVAKLFIMPDGKWIISDLRPYGFMNSGNEMLPFIKPAAYKVGDATYTSTVEKRAELAARWEAEAAHQMQAGRSKPAATDWEGVRQDMQKTGDIHSVNMLAVRPLQGPQRTMSGQSKGIAPLTESQFSMREIPGIAEGNFMVRITPAALRGESTAEQMSKHNEAIDTATHMTLDQGHVQYGTMRPDEWPKGVDDCNPNDFSDITQEMMREYSSRYPLSVHAVFANGDVQLGTHSMLEIRQEQVTKRQREDTPEILSSFSPSDCPDLHRHRTMKMKFNADLRAASTTSTPLYDSTAHANLTESARAISGYAGAPGLGQKMRDAVKENPERFLITRETPMSELKPEELKHVQAKPAASGLFFDPTERLNGK